jgi:hypothetical protein
MRAMMPAMMMRLMPLPMPNSSICSPTHMRSRVPAIRPVRAMMMNWNVFSKSG